VPGIAIYAGRGPDSLHRFPSIGSYICDAEPGWDAQASNLATARKAAHHFYDHGQEHVEYDAIIGHLWCEPRFSLEARLKRHADTTRVILVSKASIATPKGGGR